MTQKELGEKVGVSSYFISLFELRKRHPDEDLLIRIANALGQDIEKL